MGQGKVNRKPDERRPERFKKGNNTVTITLTLRSCFWLKRGLTTVALGMTSLAASTNEWSVFGPASSEYRLTLSEGKKAEWLGPLVSRTEEGSQVSWTFSPLFSVYRDAEIPQLEFEMAYPAISLDRFGTEYRFQIFQLLNWTGGVSMEEENERKRFTIFPFYFQQRSSDPEENYTAVMPFYGHLRNRLFRDEIDFVMLPLYLKSRKGEVTTWNYLLPFFHWREGPGMTGWQFWPLAGREEKEPTTKTDMWGDTSVVGGHTKTMALWPFFFNNTLGIGTTNLQRQLVLLPFYVSQVSTTRVSRSYGFPIGFTHTVDHEKRYEEWDLPYPLVVFARGPGKYANRVWPLFSVARNETLESRFYLWPLYKYNRVDAPPLDRERTRLLLFLYSDLKERDTTNHTALHRIDFWPLFTWRKDHQNRERFQALSLLEPLLPNNKSIERVYSPSYALVRREKNGETGEKSFSLLWNLYRSEHRREATRHSAFFGAFQREKTAERTRWRFFWIPFGTKTQMGGAHGYAEPSRP